jgi:hypothetical protein
MPPKSSTLWDHITEVTEEGSKSKKFQCKYCARCFSATSITRVREPFAQASGTTSGVAPCLKPPEELVQEIRLAAKAKRKIVTGSDPEEDEASPMSKRLKTQPKISDMTHTGRIEFSQDSVALGG